MILIPKTRLPNKRLWELFAKKAAGTITLMEMVEYDCLTAAIETEQDNDDGR